jgi:hypothetical protein
LGAEVSAKRAGQPAARTRTDFFDQWELGAPGAGCLSRTWFECPSCKRRCQHLYVPEIMCRICCGLDGSCRHVNRTLPALQRAIRLRRLIGADPRPFTPIARQPHARHRIHARMREIYALEAIWLSSRARSTTLSSVDFVANLNNFAPNFRCGILAPNFGADFRCELHRRASNLGRVALGESGGPTPFGAR